MVIFSIIILVVGLSLSVSYHKDANGTDFNFKLNLNDWCCKTSWDLYELQVYYWDQKEQGDKWWMRPLILGRSDSPLANESALPLVVKLVGHLFFLRMLMPTKYSLNRFVGNPPDKFTYSSGGFHIFTALHHFKRTRIGTPTDWTSVWSADGDKVKETKINSYI